MRKYSIIVPVYNQEPFIEECIQSLIKQTYPEMEILLVDDESEDQSPLICRQWAARDKRIKALAQKHAGAGAARNYGIACAEGEYLLFVDGDDFLDVNYIQKVDQVIERNAPDVVLTNHMFYYDNKTGRITERELFPVGEAVQQKEKNILEYIIEHGYGMPGGTSFNVYRKQFVENHECRFPDHIRWSEDLDFFLQVMVHRPVYCLLDAKYYYYRRNISSSSISSVTNEKLEDRFSILRKWHVRLEKMKSDTTWRKLQKWVDREYYSNLIFVVPIASPDLDYARLKRTVLSDRDLWMEQHPCLEKGIKMIGLQNMLLFIKFKGYLLEILNRVKKNARKCK